MRSSGPGCLREAERQRGCQLTLALSDIVRDPPTPARVVNRPRAPTRRGGIRGGAIQRQENASCASLLALRHEKNASCASLLALRHERNVSWAPLLAFRRPELDEQEHGKFLVVDIETGDYELDADELQALKRAKAKKPEAVLYMLRLGYPTAYRLGRHAAVAHL